jgi:hypothetical protein
VIPPGTKIDDLVSTVIGALVRRGLILIFLIVFCSSVACACSCSNYTPIQRTYERYSERAVFTARVVQFTGPVYDFAGERSSSQVLAVVRHRYWGLPWYWPSVVLLDGSYPCDITMKVGEEYLVSGDRNRFGVIAVNLCSRTQPLKTAQIDLRTLDGSHCAGPGGTLIGRVTYWTEKQRRPSLVQGAILTFRDSNGKEYRTQSDDEGIYELKHLPPGPYKLESRFDAVRYALGGGDVTGGACQESPVHVNPYVITGRLTPGIDRFARVELVGMNGESGKVRGATIASDGRFYFDKAPPGNYYLVATIDLVGRYRQWSKIYYPGVSSTARAVKIRATGQTDGKSFDFSPDSLPLVSIPVIAASPDGSRPIPIGIQLRNSNGAQIDTFLSLTGIRVPVFGIRGESYEVYVLGYGDKKSSDPDRHSDTIRVTATPGTEPVHIPFTATH